MQFSYPHIRKDSDKMKCSESLAKICWGLESMSLHKKLRMSKQLASPEKSKEDYYLTYITFLIVVGFLIEKEKA